MLNAMSCSVTNCLSVKILSSRPPCFLLHRDRFLELVRQKQSVLDQDIGDAFAERFASHVYAQAGLSSR